MKSIKCSFLLYHKINRHIVTIDKLLNIDKSQLYIHNTTSNLKCMHCIGMYVYGVVLCYRPKLTLFLKI